MSSTRIITVNNKDLILNTHDSNLKSPAYSGQGTISVYSISQFSTNQVLCVGEPGSEGSEIVLTHASTSPSGNTVTLASNLTKDHPSDIKIYVIPYDQVEFSYSATIGGSNSVLSIVNVDPEMEETIYTDSTHSSGYYYTRFKNSIYGTFADFSDAIPFDGMPTNTVGYMIDIAMSETQKVFTKKLTYDGLVREINSCLRYTRGKLKRWSNNQVFNANLGQANRGMYRLPLPTNYYDQNSNRSCLDVRIGTQDHLIYQDKQEFDDFMLDIAHSTATSIVSVGATSMVLDNSADFPQNGTLSVWVNNTLQSITYTSNDITTNTIGGIPASGTGSVTAQIPASTDIWNGLVEGSPMWFTIYGGYIYWWYPTDEVFTGRTMYMDYYTDITEVNSDSDVIPLAKFDMVKHWLKWVIRNITERNGKPDINDPDWQLFNVLLQDAIRRESTGQKFKYIPKVHDFYRGRRNNNPSLDYENYQRS